MSRFSLTGFVQDQNLNPPDYGEWVDKECTECGKTVTDQDEWEDNNSRCWRCGMKEARKKERTRKKITGRENL